MDNLKRQNLKRKNVNSEEGEKDTFKKKKLIKTEYEEVDDNIVPWSEHELLAEEYNLNFDVAKNIVTLFNEGNTIPFIARYRRALTNNMGPDELRAVKESCEEIHNLKNKIVNVIKKVRQSHELTEDLKHAITSSRSIEELEYVYAPYKPGTKRTLAERAKELGLETPALEILHNRSNVNLHSYVVKSTKGLEDITSVEQGIVHIIAAVISTDKQILSAVRELRKKINFLIKTKKLASKKEKEKTKENNEGKFDQYFDFEIPVKYIKPHQILAINRGENLKILSVKIVVPDIVFSDFKTICFKKWLLIGGKYPDRKRLLEQAVQDAYDRLVKPLITREIRSELRLKAERASCEVFSTNLKQLLLAPPFKGKMILGMDPGFANGCKLALISPMGELVTSGVIYPNKNANKNPEKDSATLKNMLITHKCEHIALGNGTACRQTEQWLTNLIQKNYFHPLDIKYTVIREDGASIYSCSAEAKKEFATLDPNIISAVSIARRLQDPLAELIKIEPKHLGVGMYQHDLKKKQLGETLNDVVSECVSFVGVDINTASQCLLSHVAGLSDKKAQHIIEYRNKHGPFISRKQLLDVNGVGKKVFLQCAGFLRVLPTISEDLSFYRNQDATKLDCTDIHPESYDTAMKIIKKLNFTVLDIGEIHFISAVKKILTQSSVLCDEFETNDQTMQLILSALSKPLNHDLRTEHFKEPAFKKELTNLSDLTCGTVLKGVVSNVTHFGCFVDIGVGINGLVHVSKYNNLNIGIGNRLEVKVLNIDIEKKRIGLQALKIL